MIQMIFSRIIFPLFLFFLSENIFAQRTVFIKTNVDKNRILLGEPIKLTVEMSVGADTKETSFFLDSIPHFEILGPGPTSDLVKENVITVLKQVYTITSFDSGHWVIPSFVLAPGIQSDTIPVDVVFSDFNPNQDYHDIKDIIEIKLKKKISWWWYAAGGALLLLLALLYFLRKKKKIPAKATTPAVSLNAYEEAMKELDDLQRSKPDAKTFHSKLTGIFRVYVFRKKGILSLQKTTDDLVLQLKGLELSKEQFDKLAQALRLSDFVKFAKYVPTKEDDSICFNTISESIKTIEQSGT